MLNSREVRYTHRVRMDYSKKRLENPFHKNTHSIKRDELSARLKVSCLVFLVLLIGLIYLMFFSSVFDIKTIQIIGLSRVSTTDVEKAAWGQSDQNRYWLLRQNNLLVFDKNNLSQTLINTYHFKEIKITKSLFHTLKINLVEREYGYIWQENDKYYYIDKAGYLINELVIDLAPITASLELATTSSSTVLATNTPVVADYYKLTIAAAKTASQDLYPIIVNVGEEHFKSDLVDIDPVYLEFTSQLNDKIKANNESELLPKYFIIDKDFNTIKAILGSGLTVYFSTKEDRDSQIRNLLVLKKEKALDFNKLIKKKIDLRYGDKVYYE